MVLACTTAWMFAGHALRAAEATDAADSGPTPVNGPVLAPVLVTAPMLTMLKQLDRTVYEVGGDVQTSTGTLSDILTAIPSVDVDPDGNLSLRGDSNVLVLVDGKPSALFSGTSAAENLQ